MSDKIFYKFKNLNDYTFDSLEKKYFYFSTPKELNDPEDCRLPICFEASNKEILTYIRFKKRHIKNHLFSYDTVDKMKKHIEENKEDNIFVKAATHVSNNFHLLSLTDSYEYLNMWNHPDYCKNFEGICIGYHTYQSIESDSDFSIKRDISVSQPKLEEYLPLFHIEYDNDRQHRYNPFKENYESTNIHNSMNTEILRYNFLHKTDKWKNEHEYRSFYFIDDSNDYSKVFYPDSTLESIAFGCNVPQLEQIKIKELIKKNYSNFNSIKFYIARNENGKIIREEI